MALGSRRVDLLAEVDANLVGTTSGGRPTWRSLRQGDRSLNRRPRVAIGGIAHETNTFVPEPTTLEAFRARSYLVGDDVVRRCRGAGNVIGGIIEAADGDEVELLPILVASALPGGRVESRAWSVLRSRFVDGLRARAVGPWPLDGVVLVLHGAMVAENDEDPEGPLLADVRTVVGPSVPIVGVLDSHANVSEAMVGAADVLVGYRTYPHVDVVERGRDAFALLRRVGGGGMRPVTALRRLPMLLPLPAQRTDGETAMRSVVELGRELEREPGIVAVDVAGGFPYADVTDAGVSVRVTADGDETLAETTADRLAAAFWHRRDRFRFDALDPDEAIDRALAASSRSGLVVLAEVADNPGSGARGDGTLLLERLLERGVRGAVVAAIPAPEAVAAAFAGGRGETVRVALGPPGQSRIDLAVRVRRLADGVFIASGPMSTGGPTRVGRTALLEIDGVEIVVCERRVAATDPALLRMVGIEPASRRLIVLKSSVHFRAAFGSLATAILEVETPGLSPSNLSSLPYRRVRRPIAPLDAGVRYLD